MHKIAHGFLGLMLMLGSAQAVAAEWDISADLRERYQSFGNFDFDSSTDDSRSEINSRLYVKAKADFGNGFTVYLQPQAVLTHDARPGNRQNLTQADLFQAYVQYQADDITLRVGRQTLVYGDQRLLGNLGWKDVARTFDGIKGMYQNDALKVDVFAVHPADIVNMDPATSVNSPQGQSLVTWEDRTLVGFYSTYAIAPKTGIDTYFINWKHGNQAAVGAGRNINTYGFRAFGSFGAVDAKAEYVRQSGTWKTGVAQKASAMAVNAGYTVDAIKTRFGIEYNFSPGDDKRDGTTQKNFVFPFHTNHAQYGEMDLFSWANMSDLVFSIKSRPATGLTLIANYHMFSLDKATGDWVNVVGTGALNGWIGNSAYSATKAGNELDLKVVYKVASVNGLKLVVNYSIFKPGAAVAERNGGKADSASFGYILASYKF